MSYPKGLTVDAIDELVARSKDHPELRRFHQFHQANRAVLDFLVSEIQLRLDHGFRAFSVHDLCGYCRWKMELKRGPGERFALNDHLATWYVRAIVILHPQYNGLAEYRRSTADEIFGTQLQQLTRKEKGYGRRLEWADGTPIERGWRPLHPHTVAPTNRRPDLHPRMA